jgi:quercetin dioxygenase-like cupin family protein
MKQAVKNPRRIVLGILFATVALFFVTRTALAQDVTTVSGGKETHKVLIDNADVRVLDVHLPPGQKVAMHSHPANVTYFVTDAKFKVTTPDGKTVERDSTAGQARWSDAATHSIENVGTNEVHLVQTELKGATAPAKK